MKKLLLISAMALAVSTAYADNTATTTVTSSGKVIAALGISQGTPMKLPDLVAPDGAEGDTTVELTCDNAGAETIAYTANGSPFTHGGTGATDGVVAGSLNTAVAGADSTGTCAELTVTGEAVPIPILPVL